MKARIRPFAPGDYPGLAALQAAVYGDYASAEGELRHGDAHRDPEMKHGRLVAEAEEGGRIVGAAEYDQ